MEKERKGGGECSAFTFSEGGSGEVQGTPERGLVSHAQHRAWANVKLPQGSRNQSNRNYRLVC